jgi:serine/threonine protein kinase
MKLAGHRPSHHLELFTAFLSEGPFCHFVFPEMKFSVEWLRMQQGMQTANLCIYWGKPLIVATMYLHHNLVRHRDIKPANCCIDQDGKLKLIDFGLSTVRGYYH